MGSWRMLLPNFFIPGAAKSGTTSLHEYLARNPEIFMTAHKEPHFFALDAKYGQGLDLYARFFAAGAGARIRGESSTGYMVFPKVPGRICRAIPEARFIFLLRNPVDRAYSHYWWLRGLGYEVRDFRTAFVVGKDEEPNSANNRDGNYKYYYQYGCYGTSIRRYLEHFERDRVLIVTSEEMKRDPAGVVNRCCAFLGVRGFGSLEVAESNRTAILRGARHYRRLRDWAYGERFDRMVRRHPYTGLWLRWLRAFLDRLPSGVLRRDTGYPPLLAEDRWWVAEFYQEEVAELRAITGQEFSAWSRDFPLPGRTSRCRAVDA